MTNAQGQLRIPPSGAARACNWCDWEDAVTSLEEGWTPDERYADPRFPMTFARRRVPLRTRPGWKTGSCCAKAWPLAGIPGVLIHGRFDLGSPPDVPWLLHRAWRVRMDPCGSGPGTRAGMRSPSE